MKGERIIVNKIRCKRCGEELESKDVHDYRLCSCTAPVGVDGGHEYLRRRGNPEQYEELSVVEKEINYGALRKRDVLL